jgi:hypothetical protein
VYMRIKDAQFKVDIKNINFPLLSTVPLYR